MGNKHIQSLYTMYLAAFADAAQRNRPPENRADRPLLGEMWAIAFGLSAGIHARKAAAMSDSAYMPHSFKQFTNTYNNAMEGVIP